MSDKYATHHSTTPTTSDLKRVMAQAWQAQVAQAIPSAPAVILPHQRQALYDRFVAAYWALLARSRQQRRWLLRRLGTSLAGAALTLALAHSPTQAAAIPVGGGCTLIDAIIAANTDTATGGCPAGSGLDTIILTTDVTLTTINNTNTGDNGLPAISSVITIEGNGHTLARASDAPVFRLLFIDTTGNLTLNDLTVSGGELLYTGGNVEESSGGAIRTNLGGVLALNNSTISGNTATFGGGISNEGATTLDNSTVSSNTAQVNGGGLEHRAGTLTVNDSTITNNTANSIGGGIFNESTMTVNNSTISGSSADFGGGIFNSEETLTVNNSTISGNTGDSGGGGIFNYEGTLTVNSSTITDNTGNFGGGLGNVDGSVSLVRSLISGNTGASGQEIVNDGSLTANNVNLFGHSGLTNAQAFSGFTPSGSDITATSDGTKPTALAAILNPTLADNGGPSTSSGQAIFTHALVAGSPAIDAAGDSGLATDQRGITRPQGTADDIGAFEVQSLNSIVTPGTPTTANNPTPQLCAATGTNLAIYTIALPQQNTSATTFTDLFYRVKVLEYTTPQGGQQPSLCNATTMVNNGGIGSTLAVPNSSLPGGDNEFNPGETLTQIFQIGRPVQAQFRIQVDLFTSTAAAAGTGGADDEYLGSFDYIFNPSREGITSVQQLFLPLVSRD